MATTLPASAGFPTMIPIPTVTGTEMQVLGNIISALAYGAVIILFCSCGWTLGKTTRLHPGRTRPLLYAYIVFMFIMSTTAFIQETIYTTKVIRNDIYPTGPDLVDYLTSLGEPIPLPFTIWGADGFMMWRCLVLYSGISPARRFVLVVFLALLCLTSLGSGIAFFAVAGVWQSEFSKSMLPFVPDSLALPFQNSKQSAVSSVVMFCTTVVNLVLALLVFLRLLYYQRFISKTLGDAHGSPYIRVITMCVESCALIVVMSTTNIVMIITNNITYLIPFMLLPHVCVISPLLIVYRVAIGRSANAKQPSNINTRNVEGEIERHTTIRFNNPMSTMATRDDFLEYPNESDPTTSPNAIELADTSKLNLHGDKVNNTLDTLPL